jgi:hypothetical protein
MSSSHVVSCASGPLTFLHRCCLINRVLSADSTCWSHKITQLFAASADVGENSTTTASMPIYASHTDLHACCAPVQSVNSLCHHTTSASLPDDSRAPLLDFATVYGSLFHHVNPSHHLRLGSKLLCFLLFNSINLFTVMSRVPLCGT